MLDDVAVGVRFLPARDDDGELALRNAYLLARIVVDDAVILRPVTEASGRVERDRVIADITALLIIAGDRGFDRSEEGGLVLRLLIAVNRDPSPLRKDPIL